MKHYKKILAIDVGGTGLKLAVIDPQGDLISRHLHVPTPRPSPPGKVVKLLIDNAKTLMPFDCISVGFPGVVHGTRIVTAPNLGTASWAGYDLGGRLSKALGKPARIVNDADMQGLAVVKGKGLEFVITLGTGFGTAFFHDGELMPHMEIAHMPALNSVTFDEYLGDKELKKIGRRKWNKRLEKMLPYLHTMLNYDHLFLGGGNAKKITFKLPPKTSIVSNVAGLKGGAALWRHGRRPVAMYKA